MATALQRDGSTANQPGSSNVLFVVPDAGRIATLRRAYADLEPKREHHRQSNYLVDLDGRWPLLVATVGDLRREGPLGPVWQSISDPDEPRRLTELPVSSDLGATDLGLALGRRWRHERPDFWQRLSPLGRLPAAEDCAAQQVAETESRSAESSALDVPELAGPTSAIGPSNSAHVPTEEGLPTRRLRLHAELVEGARRDLAAARPRPAPRLQGDLRLSGLDGLIHDPEDDLDQEEPRSRGLGRHPCRGHPTRSRL